MRYKWLQFFKVFNKALDDADRPFIVPASQPNVIIAVCETHDALQGVTSLISIAVATALENFIKRDRLNINLYRTATSQLFRLTFRMEKRARKIPRLCLLSSTTTIKHSTAKNCSTTVISGE